MSEATLEAPLDGKIQDDYEDDFERDLDWLISEARSEEQEPEVEDFEAQIDKELEEEEERVRKDQHKEHNMLEEEEGGANHEEERWPSPMEPLEGISEPGGDSSQESLPLVSAPPHRDEEELDEEKKYILEKIQQANQQLQHQEAPSRARRRRLHFKDTLVDLVVPPLDDGRESASERDTEEQEVSGRLSELQISPQGKGTAGPGGGREGRVLVEKDGKFDLVSLREVESQGLLPPLQGSHGNVQHTSSSRYIQSSPAHSRGGPTSSTRAGPSSRLNSSVSMATEPLYTPRPPSLPKNRPNSAGHAQRGQSHAQRRGTKRRVQSANNAPSHATFTLSPEQKELQLKLQQKKDRLRKEEEERRREEEEKKRHENEQAFRAWLERKKEQLLEERRVQRAQEMERLSCKRELCDPEAAYRLWLQRKQEQQERERQLEEMRKLEEESVFYLHNRQDSERAFKLWLKRKRAEKRAEKQAARERSRRLMMEARRARRMKDLLCSVNEARSLRLIDHYSYRF